ncbi:MAG: hypothetical protein WEC84_02235 [Candidatus Andersenbacteria bacterium]
MSLQSLSTIFSDKKSLTWQDDDIRFFVEKYITDRVRQVGVYCQVVNDSTLTVRVSTPLAYQEVCLGIHDLKGVIQQESGREVSTIRVTL